MGDAWKAQGGKGRGALHQRIAVELRDAIASGALPVDARLPSEVDLARRFGVSRGTVRQALSSLRQEELIEAVPGRGYFVRGAAPAAEQGESRVVGVLVPSVARPYLPDTLHGIEEELHHHGYSMVVATTGSSRSQQAGRVKRVLGEGVRGLIVYPIDYDPDIALFKGLQRRRFPLVLIDRYLPGLDVDAVTSDNIGGAFTAVSHLIELGHRRIAFVSTNNLRTTSVFERYAGYQQALAVHGLRTDPELELTTLPVMAGVPSRRHAAQDCRAQIVGFLDRDDRPTAVFALHDMIAAYVAEAAAGLGLRVPEDLAIVGFDDDPVATAHQVPLTTVAQPRLEIGRHAARLLVSRLQGRGVPGERLVLPSRLVVRRSSGSSPSGRRVEATA